MRSRARPEAELVDLASKRRRRGRWGRRVGTLLAVAVLAAVVGVAVEMLRIEEVRVRGLDTMSPSAIVEAAGLEGGERLLATRLREVGLRVQDLPQVRGATVSRVLPSAVVIAVDERAPVARLDGRPELAADREGVVIPAQDGWILPVLTGWRGEVAPGDRLDSASRRMLAEYPTFPSELHGQVRRISVGPEGELELSDGIRVLLGRPELLQTKAAVAVGVLDDARRRYPQGVEYLDVRAPRTPVVRQVEPDPPAETDGDG